MFGSKDRTLRGTAPERGLDTVIGPESTFTGSLTGQGTVRVDGRFRGEILTSDSLILGKSGDVEADVEVREALIAGRVTGKVFASERVVLQAGSHLEGDVFTNSLVIEEGVYFNGRCVMSNQADVRRESTRLDDARPESAETDADSYTTRHSSASSG
jgi:cytoskeletal protein CcmA (bactofilin family)